MSKFCNVFARVSKLCNFHIYHDEQIWCSAVANIIFGLALVGILHLVGFQSCANTIFRTVLFRSPSSNFPPIMKNFSMTNSRVLPGRISSRTFSPQTAFRYCSRVSCGSWFISSCYLPSVESHDKLVDFALQPGCCHSCMPFSYVHYCHKHFTSVLHLVRILSNRSSLLFFSFSLCLFSLASSLPTFSKTPPVKTPVKHCYSSTVRDGKTRNPQEPRILFALAQLYNKSSLLNILVW